ncbi:MAG: carbohydrate ABC transporter substrate-binding protein, partial [Anaerolineales bacterium]|nr:carbohydrate ABC transporter substrate-binding protein [Anaerolineales bacterium]
MNTKRLWYALMATVIVASLMLAACQPAPTEAPVAPPISTEEPAQPPEEAKSQLEIFSWWTAGGEADGLNAMFGIYGDKYPGVEIVNATVAGGAGSNAKAVLATRMQGGDPPDS